VGLRALLIPVWVVLCALAAPAAAQPDVSRLSVDATPARDWQDLVKRCDLIVFGWTDRAHQSFPTRERVPNGRVVNYVQLIHAKKVIRGAATRRLIHLLSTGVEPLPEASSPLNLRYPGPLAEGEYVLFLRKVKRTDLYSIVGLWQGVYPVHQGKTIALQGVGFQDLNDLTILQMEQKVKSVSP
jgi:hypothetical protein